MLKSILVSILLTISFSSLADTYVRGYYKSNGTYVKPHYRSTSDSNYNNNWSVKPNKNPYTGTYGTKKKKSPSNYFNTRKTRKSSLLGY